MDSAFVFFVVAIMGSNYAKKVLKVNHAGEFGAICIYSAQITFSRMFHRDLISELEHFKSHEINHRRLFADEMQRRGIRRCRSYFFCGLGGYVLGLMTALCGRNAIHATTFAVERVVLTHLAEQVRVLDKEDPTAANVVRQIIDEETLHHDQARQQLDSNSIWIRVMTAIVGVATETVIWLGMRL